MLYLFFLIICLNIEITWGEYAPVVRTNSGMVRGIVLTDKRNGKRVHLYKGIKYGDAKRFQKPTPAQPWTGVYSATTTRYACPQPYVPAKPFGHQIVERSDGGGPLYSSEECLFLNVFKPEEGSGSLRAVMVWIHGGTNLNGNSYAYDARYIVSLGDVVVVTINYRLGALGYLIGATEEYPGNLALYDMTLALKWVCNEFGVQQNAAHFGGDARLVTVFGESSGSMAVGTLILSPLTKGLFKRAILQSGAPNQFTGSQSAKAIGEKGLVLAAKIGCPVKLFTAAMIMACLEKANVVLLQGEVNKMAATSLFVPSFGTEFLPDNPAKLLKAGRFNTEVDLLYGSNRDEGNGVYASNPAFNPYRPVTITFPMIRVAIWKVLKAAGPILARQTNQTFQWYTRGLTEDEDEDKLRKIPARVSADQVFVCPTMLFGQQFAQLASDSSRVYSYHLTQPLSLSSTCPHQWGVCHGTDLEYVFGKPYGEKSFWRHSWRDERLSVDMINSWTSFAKTGDPGEMGGVKWEKAFPSGNNGIGSHQVMVLDVENYQMVKGYFKDPCEDFWKARIFV